VKVVRSHDLVSARDHAALAHAADLLEHTSFAIKVAGLVGRPVTHVLGMLPGIADRQLVKVIEAAILKCLNIAIESLDGTPPTPPSRWVPRVTTGVTGGLGGLFGALALPVELPLTTTLMLQSIADIARHHGEDLSRPEARLACLEVFALGDGRAGERADIGYYATRSVLTHLIADVTAIIVQRRTVDMTSPSRRGWSAKLLTASGPRCPSALPLLRCRLSVPWVGRP
jgi:EcsC protein family